MPQRKILAKTNLVYLAILHLTEYFSLQSIYMSKQFFIPSMSIHIKMKITTIYNSMSCILTREHIQENIYRSINFICCTQSNITHRSLKIIKIFQISIDIHVATQSCLHRFFYQLQQIKVCLSDISFYCSLHLLRISQCIQTYQPCKKLIFTIHISMHLSVSNMSNRQYIIYLIFPIMN